MTALRWLAFGDLDAAVWGVAWDQSDGEGAHAALGAGGDLRVAPVQLEATDPNEWLVRGDAFELTAVRAVEDSGPEDTPGQLGGLVRVHGHVRLDGDERPLASHGWAAVLELPAPSELDSLRLLAAWFGDHEGLALLAVRPRRARGQESDEVRASLIESGRALEVIDPRLSTTYDRHGAPTRAGVELWVSEPGEDPEAPSERPHRLAGEAAETPAELSPPGLDLRAQPFRWHAQGRDGAGVYLLGSPR